MIKTVLENKENIKFIGRTSFNKDGALVYYSAAGIEFNAKINGCLKVTMQASRIDYSKSGGIYFKVFLNDKFHKKIHITSELETEFILAKDLCGEYNVKIIRETEFVYGSVCVKELVFKGEFLEKPQDKELYIEFVGDSITCGYGLLYKGQKTITNNRPSISSATMGYAYKTAKALNADYSIISQSGIGVYVGYVREYNMKEIYPYISKRFSDELYDFARKPDYLVINLATNDAGVNEEIDHKPLSEIKQGFIDFLKTIRKHNPGSKIVWCYGMMRNELNDTIKEVVKELGGKEENLYTFHLPRNNEGFRWHPNLKGHINAAKALTKYLKTI